MADAASLKEAGNALFKQEQYLKAAATYTKAIKAAGTPGTEEEKQALSVLHSNRAASLLKLKKCSKALTDAEECIKLRPDWDKGYFRKAAALEEQKKFEDALAAYQKVAELNPGNREVAIKMRNLNKLTKGKAKPVANSSTDTKSSVPLPGNGVAITNQEEFDAAQKQLAGGKEIEYSDLRVTRFLEDMMANLKANGLKAFAKPTVYFLPGRADESGEQNIGAVGGGVGFDSPDTHAQYTAFLRDYADKMSAHAACAVVPKSAVAYPQVWKAAGFPAASRDDGWLVQLQSKTQNSMWWVPLRKGKVDGEPVECKGDKYNVLPPVFRS